MRIQSWAFCAVLFFLAVWRSSAAVITVTTTNNVSPAANEVSLLQALAKAQAGDEIRFNIPGTGPHYIATPAAGYPFITNQNITINGYSQPGSSPNTNSILAPNNAKIQIVLDSRQGGNTVMTFPLTNPNDDRGYEATESAVLGVVDAAGFRVQGLSFLGVPTMGENNEVSLYFISFGRGASGFVQGCWLGVDPDGQTVAGASDGVTGFRYRGKDSGGNVTNTVLVNNLIIGVEPKATNAVAQFNVLAGMTQIPMAVEGDGTRISGNFITVLPDGLHDYDVAVSPDLQGNFQGSIEIGRSDNNTLIGTDGDGVNDSNERNIFGGMLPPTMGGYQHLIEFYGQNPGTNIVIAGNYFGVGIDGKTRFTNGVPILNASGPGAEYRVGSDFNGVSDALEGNLVANNYPASVFPASDFAQASDTLSFFSQLSPDAIVSLRGNSLIDNFPFPASPTLDSGNFLVNYYAKALANPGTGVTPTLGVTNQSNHLYITGTVPPPQTSTYNKVTVDVYVADPEGMTNGMAANIPELPQGFVQGLTYLGSFVEGSPDDVDTNSASFKFDLSKLTVPSNAQLTVTANYSTVLGGGPVSGEPGTFTSVTRGVDGSITLTWDSGTLQSADAVDGPWSDEVTTGNTYTTTPDGLMKFFRVQIESSSAPGDTPTTVAAPITSPFSNAVPVR